MNSQPGEYRLDELDSQSQADPDDASLYDATQRRYPIGSLSDQESEIQSRWLSHLTGLRGVLALLVYMHHQTLFFYGFDYDLDRGFAFSDKHDNTTRLLASFPIIRLFFTGGHAVTAVFFILSGYVLSRTALIQMRRGHPTKCYRDLISAMVRRPFRLYMPPVAFTLLQAILLQLPFGLEFDSSSPEPKQNLISELSFCLGELIKLLNPFQTHGFFKTQFPYNPPLWIIPIELKGSILVFCTLALLNYTYQTRLQRVQLPFLALISVTLLLVYQWTMALFIIGIVLCMIDVDSKSHVNSANQPFPASVSSHAFSKVKKQSSPTSVRKSILFTLMLLAGMYLVGQPSSVRNPRRGLNTPGWYFLTEHLPRAYYYDEFWRFYQSIGATMIMCATLHLGWLHWLLTSRPPLFLGKMSFGLYLTHVPVLRFWGDRAQRSLGWEPRAYMGHLWIDGKLQYFTDIGMPGFSTLFWLSICLIFPVVLLIASIATRWLDEPSVRLGRLVSVRLGFEQTVKGDVHFSGRTEQESEGLLDRTI